jgi:hypothetical protein
VEGRGRRGAPRLLVAAAALLGAAVVPLPVLEARPARGGEPVLERPTYPGYRFEMRYRHSVFDIPVTERFRVDLLGRIILEQVRSTRADIIGYYDIPGAVTWTAPGEARIDPPPSPQASLRVLATEIGGRTLVAGGCTLRLAPLAGRDGAVSLEVRYRAAAAAALRWRRWCPQI